MSTIFGILKPEGQLVGHQEMLKLASATERYAPDGTCVREAGRVGMGFQPLHTVKRSKLEAQPGMDQNGNVLVFDGRLDNAKDLAQSLDLSDRECADSALVLAAFSLWGEACFSTMVGDWAVALWSNSSKTLYLARDHAGSRTLFFHDRGGVIRWSTYLDNLLAQTDHQSISEEFAAAFLCALPLRELTPYRGIQSVLPSHYVAIRNGRVEQRPHWQWLPQENLRYRSDGEYEERFLSLFRQSVGRRLDPLTPILAELSGGMDSTSIVCMADQIRHRDNSPTEFVDTVSFYDDSEPSWNERPYFSVTEAARGKIGTHIATSFAEIRFDRPHDSEDAGFRIWPMLGDQLIERERKIERAMNGRSYRVILSGIGGDELLGGVPTPFPELANHLRSANWVRLFKRNMEWCLANRTTFLQQMLSTLSFALGLYFPSKLRDRSAPQWVQPKLRTIGINRERKDITRASSFTVTPSAAIRGRAWWDIMETLPHLFPGVLTRPEYRFPYLDRDLVDFLIRVPPEQLVRPGRRRSLMRRALKDIVPSEILERKRKGYLARGPLVALQNGRESIEILFKAPLTAEYGFIDLARFRRALDPITAGQEMMQWPLVIKVIALELWLRANCSRFEATAHVIPPKSSRSWVSGRKRSAQVATKLAAS